MTDNKKGTDKTIEEEAPILGSWKNIYFWMVALNLIFVILSYFFMIIYTS